MVLHVEKREKEDRKRKKFLTIPVYIDSFLKPRLHERFFACDGDAIFLKIVASPAPGENCMCSHPRTGDATDEKIAEKKREKFNELNFLRQNHGLRQRVATHAIFAMSHIYKCKEDPRKSYYFIISY